MPEPCAVPPRRCPPPPSPVPRVAAEVRQAAFTCLVEMIDFFDEAYRRDQLLPLIKGYIANPPEDGQHMLLSLFGKYLWELSGIPPPPSHPLVQGHTAPRSGEGGTHTSCICRIYVCAYTSVCVCAYVYAHVYVYVYTPPPMCLPRSLCSLENCLYAPSLLASLAQETCPCAQVDGVSGPFFSQAPFPNIVSSRLQHADSVYN